ncbi:MAG: OmpA family protein, partial [Acidobacteria bacterium]
MAGISNSVSVEGHTDNVGQAASNQSLSEKRAQAVVAWLTSHGIEASRLKAKGWGA